jgi:methane/ammonia monooxygenase subunit C
MAAVTSTDTGVITPAPKSTWLTRMFFPTDARGNPTLPWLAAACAVIGLAAFVGVYRLYTQKYAFLYGLDYFDVEFGTYWMSLFWTQISLITLGLFIGAPWVYMTRPSDPHSMTPERELGIYNLIFTFMTVGSLALMVILGMFVEADAAWHQVTIRDTDFTPTHIGLFYLVIPAGAVGAIIGAIWLHTRMPDFVGRASVPFLLVVAAPVMIMPNLGLNEWGHTFFYAEELFSAPIHWGFVVLGWGFFGLGGFFLQCIKRVRVLTTAVGQNKIIN